MFTQPANVREWSGLLLAIGILAAAPSTATERTEADLGSRVEYGITLAFAGEISRSESLFVSLLGRAPGDPRVHTDLGNVNVLKGELDLALVFYDNAMRADTVDAGIRLNRALVLLLMGDRKAAVDEAAASIGMAGGLEAAAGLIGLHLRRAAADSVKAADQVYLSEQEVTALLIEASEKTEKGKAGVPATEEMSHERARIWRSGAPRAAKDLESATLLYWRR